MHQARRLRNRRGVLEGLPLTLIISVIIAVIGTAILFGFFYTAQGAHLSSVAVGEGPGNTPVNGWIYWNLSSQLKLTVTALSQTSGGLGQVLVEVNGSGIDVSHDTLANGTYVFLLPLPHFAQHATEGPLTIIATYNPPATFGANSPETVTVSEVILG